MERAVGAIAEFLESTAGFLVVLGGTFLGIGIAAALRFSDAAMLVLNLVLSVVALLMSGVILVAGGRGSAALHVKLDALILATDGDNDAVGIERRAKADIEAERIRREGQA